MVIDAVVAMLVTPPSNLVWVTGPFAVVVVVRVDVNGVCHWNSDLAMSPQNVPRSAMDVAWRERCCANDVKAGV